MESEKVKKKYQERNKEIESMLNVYNQEFSTSQIIVNDIHKTNKRQNQLQVMN